jgi:hypothetical protein
MADIRPLHWNGTELTKFTDAQLETLSYHIRKNYAYLLKNDTTNTYGAVTVSSTPSNLWTKIGELDDEYHRIIEYGYHGGAYVYAPYLDDFDPDRPGYVTAAGVLRDEGIQELPTLSKKILINWYYSQLKRSEPTDTSSTNPKSRLTSSVYKNSGLIGWNSSVNQTQVVGTDEDLFDTIIDDVLNELRYGDMVGSYRIETETPGTNRGGAGTWDLISPAFVDHITTVDSTFISQYLRNPTYIFNTFTKAQGNEYGYPTTDERQHDMTEEALSITNTYNLYLKMSLDTEPNLSDIKPVHYNSSNSIERISDLSRTGSLMSIFLNSVQRYHPIYTIQTTGAGTNTRGSISDTRRKDYKEEGPTLLQNTKTSTFFEYSKISYSTGDVINRATRYFVLKGISSPKNY